MDHTLALKLKTAGFPQDGAYLCEHTEELRKPPVSILEIMQHEVGCEKIKYPTLSELIEACCIKDRDIHFNNIYYIENGDEDGNYWCANARIEKECGCCHRHEAKSKQGLGETPEEAVANLYLALKANK